VAEDGRDVFAQSPGIRAVKAKFKPSITRVAWRVFWGSFALDVATDVQNGRRMERWSRDEWAAYKANQGRVVDGVCGRIVEWETTQVIDEEAASLTLDIVQETLGEVFNVAIDKISDNSLSLPAPIRAAYWDGIRSWASQQVVAGDNQLEFTLTQELAPLDLERLVKGLSGVAEVQKLALGDWVSTPAQQAILMLRDIITHSRFSRDENASPYPIADLSVGDLKAHAEIRPTDFDLEVAGESVPATALQQFMQEIALSLEKRGVHVAEVGDVLMSLWSRGHGADGWAYVTLDDICAQLGKSTRAGRQGGYEPRARDAVRDAVEKAARVHITVRDLPANHTMTKGARLGITDPFVMIRNRVTPKGAPVQGELWGPGKWDGVYIQPGAFAMHAIKRDGAEYLIRSRKLFALDEYRYRAVKLLGQKIEALFRINASKGPTLRLGVSTLLGYADLRGERLRPENREALETALDRLIEVEVLRGWQYAHGFAVDLKVGSRMTARRMEEWADAYVELEASQAVADQYAPIERKAIAYRAKVEERAERAARKEAQRKAAPTGIGADLRAKRTRLGQSVAVTAEQLGVSAATVSRIENGARVSAAIAAKVSGWLAAD
jgi:DNA-binding transcriptional regulator YiaG